MIRDLDIILILDFFDQYISVLVEKRGGTLAAPIFVKEEGGSVELTKQSFEIVFVSRRGDFQRQPEFERGKLKVVHIEMRSVGRNQQLTCAVEPPQNVLLRP